MQRHKMEFISLRMESFTNVNLRINHRVRIDNLVIRIEICEMKRVFRFNESAKTHWILLELLNCRYAARRMGGKE